MGQYWRFVNLDKRCVQDPAGGSKLGEFFFRPGLPLPINEFTIPSPLSSRVASLAAESPRIMHCSSSPNSRLLQCPDEIILLVFREIDQLSDAACFALADGKLFRIGLARIEELQRLLYSIWAGDRVLVIGDYTKDNDYPESVRDTVKEELQYYAEDEAEEDTNDDSRFHHLASEYYDRPYRSENVWERHNVLKWNEDKDESNYKALVKQHYDHSSVWVLCNISKGEFVRKTSLKDFFWADLGHAMLSRICWSSDSSIAMSYENEKNPLHRGSWAGDRFEVTTMDRLRSDIEWRDVSKEVADTLLDIYRFEYGSVNLVHE
ncbi:hypothetical protein BC835DRAFT_1423075 [Cytidiella melzeri]|nr:hypothetical protein BC835DRAFT_1423075 [Cytidiella melzeri]